MASKKQISVAEIEKQIEGLPIHEKLTVYKNLTTVIDAEMNGIKTLTENNQSLCNDWADLRNPKQS